ncbi:Domain of unknown function (DUF4149) [Chthonomonas calidirosea]|uniref:DUF4149 domain-containing protein n=1 Tax=Chthonomonas calidirosea TaxID=454171 RepID=UPI0006DD407D|nr:DUF4149 domain-containing protein [Chthonomonas calidirosea]CEK17230.1 Domain of unknown function (DUF4149) [Chthonomonas calidirosea]CEK17237.1 Domain of unknown function (DUF4149) [Chthonomonas calidirosea]
MIWSLLFVRQLALTLWLGGLVVIDFVETPIRFRVPEVNRNQVVAIGRRVFAALNKLEVIAGAILLLSDALLLPHFRAGVRPLEQSAMETVAAMWLAALVQLVWVRPRMSALTRGLDLVNRDPADPRFAKIGRLHKVYSGLDLLKMLLGLLTLALWVHP